MEHSNTGTEIATFKDLEQNLIEKITRSVLGFMTKPKETQKKKPETVPYSVPRSIGSMEISSSGSSQPSVVAVPIPCFRSCSTRTCRPGCLNGKLRRLKKTKYSNFIN